MANRLFLMCFIPEGGLLFGLVGGVGFIVDGGILTVLATWLGMNVYAARAFSFPVATLVTWYLNRSFTFKSHAERTITKEEYVRYFVVQVGGSLLNLVVFVVLIYYFNWMDEIPLIPLAAGAVFGMVFNYTFSRIWVFRVVQANE